MIYRGSVAGLDRYAPAFWDKKPPVVSVYQTGSKAGIGDLWGYFGIGSVIYRGSVAGLGIYRGSYRIGSDRIGDISGIGDISVI